MTSEQIASLRQRMHLIDMLLTKAGFNATIRPIVIAQVMHETNDLANRGATDLNNYSGIKYTANSPFQASKSGMYAKYRLPEDWAKDLKRILSFNTGKQGKPIDATTYQEYAKRLKANKYYEDSLTNYTNALAAKIKRNQQIIKSATPHLMKKEIQNAADVTMPKSGELADIATEVKTAKDNEARWQWIKDNPIPSVFIGLGGIIFLRELLR